jgi:hypothetical protein
MFQTKKLTVKEVGPEGRVLAVIVDDLSAVDHDGDTYVAGAFMWKGDDGQWAMIVPAHQQQHLPLGKVRVYEEAGAVLAEMNFNLATQAGQDWFTAIKFDVENGNPVQEWSFGYQAADFDFRQDGVKRVRVLKQVDVREVSPVLRGAGLRTRTLDVKGLSLKSAQFDQLVAGLEAVVEVLSDGTEQLSATGLKQLADLHDALSAALDVAKKGAEKEVLEENPEPEAKSDADDDRQAEHLIAAFLLQSARTRA